MADADGLSFWSALHNSKLQRYLRAFASWHGVNNNDNNPNVSYNTRVELIEKRHNEDGEEEGWTLTLKELVPSGRDTLKAIWTKEVSKLQVRFKL